MPNIKKGGRANQLTKMPQEWLYETAIGGGALVALGLAGRPTDPGELILAVAVLSILLTAPVGAWAISWSGERWLSKDESGIKSPVPADNY